MRTFDPSSPQEPGDTRHVRSWYGLDGEIVVENELWHLVRVGKVTLNHPPVVNTFIRAGLPRSERLRLSYLHEYGHFQTLPLALLHAAVLLGRGLGKRRSPGSWIGWLVALLVAHEAVWELASESYVAISEGPTYRRTYRSNPNPFLPVFWISMAALSSGLTWLLARGRGKGVGSNDPSGRRPPT